MKKLVKIKKTEKNKELSLNHGKALRFRKRIQEDKEHFELLKEWDAGKQIQDDVLREYFPPEVCPRPK